MDPKRRDTSISKALSYLLRHGAVKERLDIDANGYVDIGQVLLHQRLKSLKTTRDDLIRIVAENDKQRFSIDAENDAICANQGHSIQTVDDLNLVPLATAEEFPGPIFHGTYAHKMPLIEAAGLSRMNRNHIHFTSDGAKSGIRRNCNVLIYIDVHKCLDAGMTFFRSANGVILSSGIDGVIPAHYFAHVERKSI